MPKERLPRKLAAILYADVAGYSRLTGDQEDDTHRRLAEYLDLISHTVERHRGRVMHYAGDAVLAMFEAVVDALACAAHVQRELNLRNSALPDERRVQFRTGVNLGDVIEDRGDIYGDGVNVAARLESLAQPGGICVSESVRLAVGQNLPIDYQFLGEQHVKNIAGPVRAYHARLKANAELPELVVQPRPARLSKSTRWRWYAAAVFVVVVTAVSVLGWYKPWEQREESAPAERMAYPLPDKPSIAVLPFDNMSGDPAQEYFADGITEDLTTDLSKISALFVIARNSAFMYKSKAIKPEQVARDLGVRYILEGSVRRSEAEVRVNAQLIDSETGGHLWADRYDGSLKDIFALQDKITANIVEALALRLTADEQALSSTKETVDPLAYDLFLQGWEHYLRLTPEGFEIAADLFEKATEIDPGYARADAALAATYWQTWKRQWHGNIGFTHAAWARADEYLQKAMANPSPLAHQIASEMLTVNRRYNEALAEAQRAIDLEPNRALGHVALAEVLTYAGKAEEAVEPIKKAMRLDPHSPAAYFMALGRAQFALKQYEHAAATLERAVQRNPGEHDALVYLVAAYGHLNRSTQAKATTSRLNDMRKDSGFPPFTLETLRNRLPYKQKLDRDLLLNGLRRAGLPEW